MALTKADIIQTIAQQTKLTKDQSHHAVETLMELMKEALASSPRRPYPCYFPSMSLSINQLEERKSAADPKQLFCYSHVLFPVLDTVR